MFIIFIINHFIHIKFFYRIIDFKRNKLDVPGTVSAIEYDPNRTANIALISYKDGEKRYIIAPNTLKVGDVIVSSENADIYAHIKNIRTNNITNRT